MSDKVKQAQWRQQVPEARTPVVRVEGGGGVWYEILGRTRNKMIQFLLIGTSDESYISLPLLRWKRIVFARDLIPNVLYVFPTISNLAVRRNTKCVILFQNLCRIINDLSTIHRHLRTIIIKLRNSSGVIRDIIKTLGILIHMFKCWRNSTQSLLSN